MTVFSAQERYRRNREIGQGGMGEVWLAADTLLDRPVAIKYPLVTSSVSVGQLLQEARMLAKLNHPNITTLYDFFVEPDTNRFYLVMEYVDGKSLDTIIADGQRLPLEISLEIVQGVLRALSYAHAQGVIHRDIKPANVMIADEVKLTDFGLANLAALLGQGTDHMAGTPAYMAPEQIEGRPMDGRTDLYSLGVTLFELLSGGHLPFKFTNTDEMFAAHLHTSPLPLSRLVPDIPPVLEQIITRLLAKDPAERYSSAEAVMEVLDAIHVGPKLGRLPVPLTPFIGREVELAELKDRLQDPACRLLTLVGPGGSGKTRLVLEAAAAQTENYAHGVFFVSLAPLDSVDSIVPTVAEALDFRFYEEGEPQQQLLDYLRQKSMLLIFDNFEHLVEGAGLVSEILQVSPEVKILATSRARLNVQGEHLFAVGGMSYPDRESHEEVTKYSAINLFLSTVRRTQPHFEPTTDELADVVRICRVLQGMPLGILLAAGWLETLTPSEIVSEISKDLDFLETDLRDVPERQRSLRAVFDYSWELLTERERGVFQGLSVFRGGFTRQAAQAVTDASLRELMALVNKSVLQRTSAGRYGMHELLRQYAAEKLATSEEARTTRDAHSVYYAGFLHQREADLKGRRQLEALDEIESDFENVRAAWNWTLKQKNYSVIDQMVRGLGWFCSFRSRNLEHRELFQRAREQLAPDSDEEPHFVWGRILVAEFYARPREVDKAQIERGLAIAKKHGARRLVAVCLAVLGGIALNAGDYAEALAFHEESLAHCRALDDNFYITGTLYRLAETYRLLGQPDKAITLARQSLDLSREIGDKFWAAHSLANTGVVALYTGNYTEAEGHLQEANATYRELGHRVGIAESNVVLGKLAFLRGDFEVTTALTEEAFKIATDIGNKRIAQSVRSLDSAVAMALGEKAVEHPYKKDLLPITDIPPTIDRFQIKELLGAGSLGSVYLAHDPDSGRDVVVKVANPEALRKLDWASRMFNREAEVTAKLKHPAFPEFYGYGETADSVYIVTEYISGKDLEEILEEQEGFLPEKAVIEWALQLCDALTYMHSQRPTPIIFRDVKPANVMIDHCGRARWVDFLFVEPYQAGKEQPPIGRKHYVSPEGYIGYSDARSDIYALGATLYHLLTRRDPRCETPFSFHNAPPRSLNSAISEELEAVVLKAVEYKAKDRYQSAAEMKAALLACPR